MRRAPTSQLLLRVVVDGRPAPPADLAATVERRHTVGDLAAALAARLGVVGGAAAPDLRVERTGEVPAPEAPLAAADLVSGDVVTIGDALGARSVRPRPVSGVAFDVVTGPDAGRSFGLSPGVTTVGRSRQADIRLGDTAVSRRHLTIMLTTCGELTVVVHPTARNGVLVDGVRLGCGASSRTRVDAELTLGASRVVVRRVPTRSVGHRQPIGRVRVVRAPRRPPAVNARERVVVGPVPSRAGPRRLQLVAAIAPLAAGLVMYAVSGHAQFLLFTLVSPVVMVGTVFDDRRHGRRRFALDAAEFRATVERQRADLAARARRERADRLVAAPDLAAVARCALLPSAELWSRASHDPDVGVLRLGLGDGIAGFDVEIQPGGDERLRADAHASLSDVGALHDVPVTIGLDRHHLAIRGRPALVDGVATSLIVQAAVLHGPGDVRVVVAPGLEHRFGWSKWLPHARPAVSLGDPAGSGGDGDGPLVIAVADGSLPPPAVAQLFGAGRRVGVVWLTDPGGHVPRAVRSVLDVEPAAGDRRSTRLWSLEPGGVERWLDVESLSYAVAGEVARALAPIGDPVEPVGAVGLPDRVTLLDVLELAAPTAEQIARRWATRCHGALVTPIGVGRDGRVEVDLVGDGPHSLIAGTSGAGKSELLQAMIAGLAANHPPSRVTFLFVDYKGGASTQVFDRLPHTVGSVTNLSPHLAGRALVSLRAELDRRMALFDGRARDLAEMERRHPGEAPPALVIVVDEFATLAAQVPEFVAGVIDIAQRGRSLGIHLVLATQRPSGSVDGHILANTNLRISLRVLERGESTMLVGAPDAADIPSWRRGRAFLSTGSHGPVELQCALGGAAFEPATPPRVTVARFDRAGSAAGRAVVPAPDPTAPTQLDVVVDAVVEAHAGSGGASPRRPWCDLLPAVVPLDTLLDETPPVTSGGEVVIGLLDLPDQQVQRPAVVDLEASGGLLAIGAGGSGRTTLLRTIAVGIDRAGHGVTTIVFDFASRGLAGLTRLDSVIEVATDDDLEAVTRHLLALDAEISRRRRAPTSPHARIVLLIDGFDAFVAVLLDPSARPGSAGERWADVVDRVVTRGRRVGVHVVAAVDRRAAVPARLLSSFGARVVLRHADPQSYLDLGVRPDQAAVLDDTPGRALLDGSVMQIAVADVAAAGAGGADDLVELARRRRRLAPSSGAVASSALPARIGLDELPDGAIGVADVTGEPVGVDLTASHLAIVGPPRSGRSTAIAAVVAAVSCDVHLVATATSPLVVSQLVSPHRVAVSSTGEIGGLLDRVASLAIAAPDGEPLIVAVDDLDAVDDPQLEPAWRRLLGASRVRLVASIEPRAFDGFPTTRAHAALRRSRRQLVLHPDDPAEFVQLTGLRWPGRPGLSWVPGRGVLIADREPTIVQVADPLGEPAPEFSAPLADS